MTVAIVTDSSACVPAALAADRGIRVVPHTVSLGEESRPASEVDRRELLDRVETGEELHTAAPSPGAFLEAVESDGDAVVVLTVPASMSSTRQNASLAADQSEVEVRVVDTGTAAGGLGLVALAAAEAAQQGAGPDEVEAMARRVAGRVRLVATVGSLEYLARSGRVPDLAGRLGDRLGIRPLFEFRGGEANVLAPKLSASGARARLLSELRDNRPGGDARLHVAALHADDADEARRLLEAAGEDAEVATAFVAEFDPAMIVHTGPDVLGLAWWWDERG